MKNISYIIKNKLFMLVTIFFPAYCKKLSRRIMIIEVGFTGTGSTLFDKNIAEKENLKPLNKIERWYFKPFIEELKEIHHQSFKEAYEEVLGEDYYE